MALFNKIRLSLIPAEGMKRYLFYATGEILLVMIGILLAVEVTNWNDERKVDQQFYNGLFRAYNEIMRENQQIDYFVEVNRHALQICDSLLQADSQINETKALFLTSYLANQYAVRETKDPKSPVALIPNPERPEQIALNEQVLDFWHTNFGIIYSLGLNKLYEDQHFPMPEFNMFLNLRTRKEEDYAMFFSKDDLNKFRQIRTRPEFINAIKTEKSNLANALNTYDLRLNNGRQAMKAIKAYRPDVHADFEEIGILGDAIGGWENSIPMRRKPGTESTWQTDTVLSKGFIKFRSHNTWEENWGGSDFPAGKTLRMGDNIPVLPGRYHIELDLVNGRYVFQPLNQ